MLPVVALHYWAGSGRAYAPLRERLPGARLLAPDLPGFGGEPAPADFDYSVGAYADWVAAYVAGQGLGDYLLIGHSMGGKVALALAARQPPGLRGLLLLAPSPPGPEPMPAAARAAALAAWGHPEEAEKTFNVITNRPLPPAWRRQVLADNLRTTRAAWDAWLLAGSREDLTALMPQVQVPCRLLTGTADRAITSETQRRLTLPLLPPGTELTEVPSAGHLLPLEAVGEVVAAVLGWGATK